MSELGAEFEFGTYVRTKGRAYSGYIGIIRRTIGDDCWLEVILPKNERFYDWYPCSSLERLNLLEILAIVSDEP